MRDWSQYNVNTIRTGHEDGKRLVVLFAIDFKEALQRDIDKNFISCGRCAKRELNNFLKYSKTKTMKKSEKTMKKFKVKAKYFGLALSSGSKVTLSSKGNTDELCAKFANEHPRGLQIFDSIPEDFKIGKSYGDYTPESSEEKTFENAEDLKKAFDRPTLDEMATNIGLNPEEFKNKLEVATAIFNVMSSDINEGGEEE